MRMFVPSLSLVTCTAAGALGPEDLGNPNWLILTNTRALTSADGVAWANQAHGFPGANPPTKRCAAYSRTARRWVAAGRGAAAGDIYYSNNGGASWVLIAGALKNASGTTFQVACDGVKDWVSS